MLRLNIDFFSSGRIAGWTTAVTNEQNKIIIRDENGTSVDITEKVDILRKDVNASFNLPNDLKTGFNLNLFDLFNTKVSRLEIYINDYEAWTSERALKRLESETRISTKNFFEIGSKRIVVLYDVDSWLNKIVGQLNAWNSNQCNKSLNNGVAISFMAFDEMKKLGPRNKFLNSQNFFLIERDVARKSIIFDNNITRSPLLILEPITNCDLDFDGALSSIFAINNYPSEVKMTSRVLREIIDTICTFSDMFYPQESPTLLYMAGSVSASTESVIRELNLRKNEHHECVITGAAKVEKLSDFDPKVNAIFLGNNLLRRCYDLFGAEPSLIIKMLLKRGVKIKVIYKED